MEPYISAICELLFCIFMSLLVCWVIASIAYLAAVHAIDEHEKHAHRHVKNHEQQHPKE